MDYSKLFSTAHNIGLDSIQLLIRRVKNTSVKTYKNKVEDYKLSDVESYKIEGVHKGKKGVIHLESLDEDDFEDIVKKIKEYAENIDSKDQEFIYPGDDNYELFSSYLNKGIKIEEKIERMLSLYEIAKVKCENLNTIEAIFSENEVTVRILNNSGLDIEETHSYYSGGIEAVVKREEKLSTSYISFYDINYNNIKFEKILEEILEDSINKLEADNIETDNYEVIIKNDMFCYFLKSFIPVFSAEKVQKNKSWLKDKLNKKIFGNNVTIIEDPRNRKLCHFSFDNQGVKTSYKEIVKEGVLTTYLHDLKTAVKDKVKPTGNCFSNMLVRNFYIEPGEISLNQMINSVEKGVYINCMRGLHAGVNTINGDFSIQSEGYLIEKGKLTKPLKQIIISGNFFEMMNDIKMIGDDLVFKDIIVGSPSIKIGSLTISGK